MAWVQEEQTPEQAISQLYQYLQEWRTIQEKRFKAWEEDLERREVALRNET